MVTTNVMSQLVKAPMELPSPRILAGMISGMKSQGIGSDAESGHVGDVRGEREPAQGVGRRVVAQVLFDEEVRSQDGHR